MQTPEQMALSFTGECEPASLGICANHKAPLGGATTCLHVLHLSELIRARDAEVRADERAKVLAGFEVEWGVELTPRPGKPNPLGPPRPTTEKQARQEHAVNQAWFDDGDAAWCNAYEKSTLVRRLVGPWEPAEEDA